MAVHFKVLVQPGRDNPLYVTVDIGQSLHRLLFDCGEGVLASLPVVDVQQIEALFFWQFQARLFWLFPKMRSRMLNETRIFTPGPNDRTVRAKDGEVLQVPDDWELLPPGDAAFTRRVKAAGPCWTIQEMKGRKTFSRGVWAPADRIASIRAELEAERSTETYAKRRAADAARREKRQSEYAENFRGAVWEFLDFAPGYAALAEQLADAITTYATPVGSGTVARTQRIPIEQRAESAVIAWLRHQTTAYDTMKIARIKGKRREVRRQLAEESRRLLAKYRSGEPVEASRCPLQSALANLHEQGETP